MAVHCGACGTRLADATENYGGFAVNSGFNGWNQEPGGRASVLHDTCKTCWLAIAAAATETANRIVAANKDTHDRLRAELHEQRDAEADFKQAEAAFHANYRRVK